MERIYLDHAATSPLHPKAIERMTELMPIVFGNPSSVHSFGREARKIVDEARYFLASTINAKTNEIVFTSGGTEADNMAIFSVAATAPKGAHFITSAIEHHAVLHAFAKLEKQGFAVTYLPVDEHGIVSAESVAAALRDETVLVSIMYGNNEIGALQPIADIGAALRGHKALFHTDAVQAYGTEQIDVQASAIDLLSVTSHKLNGPKGVGFLYVRQGVKLPSLLVGGEQERKRRAGTENVMSIAGFHEAAKAAYATNEERKALYQSFKHQMLDCWQREGIAFSVNGSLDNSLAHVLNVHFPGMHVESFLMNLDLAGIAASSGSACTAGSVEPSHVLVALYGEGAAPNTSSIRFSFGLSNTEEQIARAAEQVAAIVKRFVR